MHGWTVYCQVNGNGYRVESEHVTLLVYGLEAPAHDSDKQPAAEESPVTEKAKDNNNPAAAENSPQEDGQAVDTDGDSGAQNRTFRVTCSAKALRTLDSSGTVADNDPVSELEFTGTGSFIVTSEDMIKSWTINGIRFEPDEPVKEFTITNATQNISVTLNTSRVSAASIEIDENRLCRVTCIGCTFTYIRGGLRSVTEGEVPAGAPINVIADSSDMAVSGYRINGGDPINAGLGSFRIIVNEDMEISLR